VYMINRFGVLELRVKVRVRTRGVENQPALVEIRVLHHDAWLVRVIIEDVAERMRLVHIQPPAGLQQAADHLGPTVDIREPAHGSDRDEHDVEPAPKGFGGIVYAADPKRPDARRATVFPPSTPNSQPRSPHEPESTGP